MGSPRTRAAFGLQGFSVRARRRIIERHRKGRSMKSSGAAFGLHGFRLTPEADYGAEQKRPLQKERPERHAKKR